MKISNNRFNQTRLLSRFVLSHFVPAQTAPSSCSLVKRTLERRSRAPGMSIQGSRPTESVETGKIMNKREKNLHVHRWYNKPKIWKRLKNFGLAFAATAVIASCESCIPNLQPIPPQITLSAQESSVKKDNPAKLNVKITDKLGNDNIAEWGYKADYDGNGTISEDEKK